MELNTKIQDRVSKAAEAFKAVESLIKDQHETEALLELDVLLKTCPDFAPAQNKMGILQLKKQNMEAALKHLRIATELDPMNPDFQNNLADVYRLTPGKTEEAMKCYIKVPAIHPTHVQTLISLGQVCREVNKPGEAEYFFERALEIEPWNLKARENLEKVSA